VARVLDEPDLDQGMARHLTDRLPLMSFGYGSGLTSEAAGEE
jgi:hypothetical protein